MRERACVCVCVCVCVSERERERERECVCVCVRERERCRAGNARNSIMNRCFRTLILKLVNPLDSLEDRIAIHI